MQAYKVKLTHDRAVLLHRLIKVVFVQNEESELLKTGDYETLFIMCSLKPLYSKLNTAIEFKYNGEKSFKLKPLESLALHCIVAYQIVLFPPQSWEQNVLQVMSNELHQFALTPGTYFELPEVAAHKQQLGSGQLHQMLGNKMLK